MSTSDKSSGSNATQQDTPGRPNSSSSRQQTHLDQATQTGAPEIDADSDRTAKPKRKQDLNSMPDRPARD
jgi:hypothetical protein